MWLKVVCFVVIASSAVAKQDELLDELYGVEGRNKIAICVRASGGNWRRCDGALYNREWVVARAHCLGAAPSRDMAAERVSAGGACHLAAAGNTGLYRSRAVRHHIMHPWFDLAIVIVKTPYNNLDQLANATKTRLKLRRHGVYKWMKHYFDAFALTRNYDYNINRIARSLKTYHHPIWYFFTTMVLPSALFMLFFVYVTFYTGKTQEVPYKQLRYSKKLTHV
ncbi:unnamed protein product [Spodoptera exigua]|uniref:Peptidase S1 domain-containing protein n=1 Tax=Spodoptera exigua TaxID=7107 RepID=A0A835KZQ6_SPOEX|nr:hypothetical protein HW555_010503 [Spodoptera exigua]KAH9628210.1 hypothetical protein HF086_006841 [Spodoptera exigua]CAH0701511.1 unnamed protein product [Spodoptera exigua]